LLLLIVSVKTQDAVLQGSYRCRRTWTAR